MILTFVSNACQKLLPNFYPFTMTNFFLLMFSLKSFRGVDEVVWWLMFAWLLLLHDRWLMHNGLSWDIQKIESSVTGITGIRRNPGLLGLQNPIFPRSLEFL